MRYSVSSRFRGTLVGAAVGGIACKSTSNITSFEWGRPAVVVAKSLIALGRFDLDDWCNVYGKEFSTSVTNQSLSSDKIDPVFTKVIIATLPISLFYHENEIKLRQNIQHLAVVGQDNRVVSDGALAVGYAIAQFLTEKINPAALIPQTIDFLGESPSELVEQLTQVQTLLEQGAGLERAVKWLGRNAQPSTSIALAFYCLLSTLEDLQLSVLRAARTQYQPQITSAITGALSGAYNSLSGIPVNWRLLLSRPDAQPLAAWGMTTEAEMLELSDSLVAVWSGVYNRATHLAAMTPITAIAAPQVMRLR